MLRSPKVVLAGAGLALSLAACGATPDAAPTPAGPSTASTPTSEAPAPTSTPTPTPTSVATVQAEEPTFTPTGTFNENDALAFGQYAIQIVNHVRTTGDPSLLQKYADASCRSCEYVTELTNGLRENNARLLHPELTFEAAYLDFYDEAAAEADVRVEVSGDLGQVVLADGTIDEEPNPLDHASVVVQMAFRDGEWKLQEVL